MEETGWEEEEEEEEEAARREGEEVEENNEAGRMRMMPRLRQTIGIMRNRKMMRVMGKSSSPP
eukprot:8069186-Pyramimonas_sp.AAC.1